MNAICVENLTKRYGVNEVLKGVNLKVAEGEFYALMGPNGSGKTTLASIITSVRMPTSGSVDIYGRKPWQAKEWIGYVPQENFSSPKLTGRENLMYFARLLGYSGSQAKDSVNEMLDRIGLLADADKRVGKYSGGMRKRLEVATALFPGVRILILDEPTTGLDPSARRKFLGLVEEIKDKQTTIFLITHIGADAELASKVGLIDNGKIIAEGEPEALKRIHGLQDVIAVAQIIILSSLPIAPARTSLLLGLVGAYTVAKILIPFRWYQRDLLTYLVLGADVCICASLVFFTGGLLFQRLVRFLGRWQPLNYFPAA